MWGRTIPTIPTSPHIRKGAQLNIHILIIMVVLRPVLWIQIHWNWIRFQEIGPIWIRILSYRYVINFEEKIIKKASTEKIFFNIYGKCLSSILHLLPLIFISVYPDPYSEYGSRSGSKKFLNTDPIWIHSTASCNYIVNQQMFEDL